MLRRPAIWLILLLVCNLFAAHAQENLPVTTPKGELKAVCESADGIQWAVTDAGEILRSAEAICRALPSASLHRLPELRHGEFSINQADRYADAVRQIVRGEKSAAGSFRPKPHPPCMKEQRINTVESEED